MLRSRAPSVPAPVSDLMIEGFRVFLRPPRAGDNAEWRAVRAENERYLRPFEPQWDEDWRSPDCFIRRLTRQTAEWREGKGCAFMIFKRRALNASALIGGININNIARGAAQYASLGYWIAEGEQGQGYMSEALRLVKDYAFGPLGLHRLNAACLPENERSKKLLLNGGFKEEGFAEKYIEINGAWRDHILFGLPAETWREIRTEAAESR